MRFIIFFPLFLFFSNCSTNSSPDKYLNHSDTVHYVGINTCKQCHMEIYKTFIRTGMGQSFDVATKRKSSAKFDSHTVIHDNYSNFYYHPFWKNDTLRIKEFRLDGTDTVYQRTEKVDYIVGSGQHTNSHIANTNGYLHQMPLTFYTQKGTWDLPPGFENGFNTRFSRKIGLECMSCHNALPGFVQGSENKFSDIPEGINCERCHGPGSAHVALKQQGVIVDTAKDIDYSIVNPAKLPIDLQFEVCQRCHLQGNAVLKEGKSFLDFLPGMRLSDIMTVFLPKYEGADDEFIMASHADRLKMSQCFIKDKLSCITCHNPHVSVRNTDDAVFNNACKNCHGNQKKTECSEQIATRNEKQDNCVSCHMPKSGAIDIPHVRITDHYIRKPIILAENEKKKVKKFIGLFAINEKSPSPKIKAQAYINQFEKFDFKNWFLLDSAKKYLPDNSIQEIFSNFPQLTEVFFLKKNYKQVLNYVSKLGKTKVLQSFNRKSLSNEDAWTLYRIGESFSNEGDVSEAYDYFKKADELAPFNQEFKNKLGTNLVALSRTDEAQKVFESIIQEDANYAQAHCNLGYIYVLKGNPVMAEEQYNLALALDPDYVQATVNKAGLYRMQKQTEKAKKVLSSFLKYHPGNVQVITLLEKLKTS